MSEHRPITVSILATPDTSPSTLYGLSDLFSSVGIGWESFVTGKPEAPRFDVRIVAATDEPFQCSGNVTVTPHASSVTLARSCIDQIAENYRRLQDGRALINAVDPTMGY